MSLKVRDIQTRDLDQVLALNNNAGPGILPINADAMRHLFNVAAYFRVAEVDDHIAGFLIALRSGVDYASTNYQWFSAQYDEFVYIDRIVIAKSYRGLGLGSVFYADVQSFAEVRSPVLCCEVFLTPSNDYALLFHGTTGFAEVGQISHDNQTQVSMLAKSLCSYPFVRDTYLNVGSRQLPHLPWLSERNTLTAGKQNTAAS